MSKAEIVDQNRADLGKGAFLDGVDNNCKGGALAKLSSSMRPMKSAVGKAAILDDVQQKCYMEKLFVDVIEDRTLPQSILAAFLFDVVEDRNCFMFFRTGKSHASAEDRNCFMLFSNRQKPCQRRGEALNV